MVEIVILSSVLTLLYMTIWWLFALSRGRNDVADIAWGLGFVVLCIALAFYKGSLESKVIIVLAMVTTWGVRLATHIAIRHAGKPEDARYVAMRESWKFKTLQSYTNVFLSQGFFLLLVSAPIILFFSTNDHSIEWYNLIGLIIWLIGLTFEAVGDYQLTQFIKTPKNKGKIMRYGLWRYTRHPNYFGEISLWWGFYLFTLFTPYWYIGLIGPATITFLIIGVSGIPMLEKRYIGNKEYESYKKSTSAFFPLLPKK